LKKVYLVSINTNVPYPRYESRKVVDIIESERYCLSNGDHFNDNNLLIMLNLKHLDSDYDLAYEKVAATSPNLYWWLRIFREIKACCDENGVLPNPSQL